MTLLPSSLMSMIEPTSIASCFRLLPFRSMTNTAFVNVGFVPSGSIAPVNTIRFAEPLMTACLSPRQRQREQVEARELREPGPVGLHHVQLGALVVVGAEQVGIGDEGEPRAVAADGDALDAFVVVRDLRPGTRSRGSTGRSACGTPGWSRTGCPSRPSTRPTRSCRSRRSRPSPRARRGRAGRLGRPSGAESVVATSSAASCVRMSTPP